MPRTTSALVRGVLEAGRDYDTKRSPDLTGYVATAHALVTRVNACAVSRGYALSAEELELIERWLAAHFYAMSDQPYASRSTQGASGSFQGKTGMYFEATKYGQTAVNLDPSGCLDAVGKRRVVQGYYLGTPPDQQAPNASGI